MSSALFAAAAGGRHASRSAGTQPASRVHPEVVTAMRELGVDLSAAQPGRLTTELAGWADVVVTMGCGDECPVIPGRRYIDWDLQNPKGQSLEQVRVIRDDIQHRVRALVGELDSALAPA